MIERAMRGGLENATVSGDRLRIEGDENTVIYRLSPIPGEPAYYAEWPD